MAQPRKTSTGTWRIRYDAGGDPLAGKRLQKCETFATKSQASVRLREIAAAKASGGCVADDRTPFGVWLSLWLQDWVSVDASTLRSYRSKVRMLQRSGLGSIRLGDLQPDHLRQFYRALEAAGKAPGTIRGYARLIGASLGQAVALGKVAKNPAANQALRRALPKDHKPERPTYCLGEVVRMLEVASQPQRTEDQDTWPALALMVLTGLRECEVLGLKHTAVHQDDGYLEVSSRQQVLDRADNAGVSRRIQPGSKTPKSVREVVLPVEAIELLGKHLARQDGLRLTKWRAEYRDAGLVFCHEWGEPLGPWNLRSAFRRLQHAAGLKQIKVHDLRHTYASRSLEVGNPLEEVSKTLGHSSVKITADVYAHVSRKRNREAAARLTSALRSARAMAGPARDAPFP